MLTLADNFKKKNAGGERVNMHFSQLIIGLIRRSFSSLTVASTSKVIITQTCAHISLENKT